MYNDLCRKVSEKELKKLEKGKGSTCRWAWFSCANDTFLGYLGTSDPGSTCSYMKKVCN